MKIETETEKTLNLEDEDDNIVQITFNVSREDIKKIGHKAVEEGVSRAEIIRRAIKQYIKNNVEKPQEQNPKIPDKALNKILKACSEGGGFDIDGEEGFIALMKDKGFKLKNLTNEQWEKVKKKLQIGYDGYFFKPEPEEFAEKFEPLEPSEEQREWLSTAEEEETE